MSKQANKTVIGIFMVSAIALVVAAVLVLGSGKFFKKTLSAVCFFEGSVGGLNIGSPVVFRGVKVGSVTRIVLRGNRDKLQFTIPVYIELEPENIEVSQVGFEKRGEGLRALIQAGLKAKLETQSIVTGQLQIALDMEPDKPAKFAENRTDTQIPEIPTIPTPLKEFVKKIEKLPIDQIFDKLAIALDEIDKLVKSPEIPEALRSVNLALGDVRKLVNNVDGQVGPLATNLNGAVQDVRKLVQNADTRVDGLASNLDGAVTDVRGLVKNVDTKVDGLASNLTGLVQNADTKISGLASNLDEAVKDVRGLVKNVDGRIEPLHASIEGTLKTLDATLISAQKAIEKIDGTVSEDSMLIYELNKTLEDVSALARSIRTLSDYLERRPESVIRGK